MKFTSEELTARLEEIIAERIAENKVSNMTYPGRFPTKVEYIDAEPVELDKMYVQWEVKDPTLDRDCVFAWFVEPALHSCAQMLLQLSPVKVINGAPLVTPIDEDGETVGVEFDCEVVDRDRLKAYMEQTNAV